MCIFQAFIVLVLLGLAAAAPTPDEVVGGDQNMFLLQHPNYAAAGFRPDEVVSGDQNMFSQDKKNNGTIFMLQLMIFLMALLMNMQWTFIITALTAFPIFIYQPNFNVL